MNATKLHKAKMTPGPWLVKETSDGCLNITIGQQPISIYNRADAKAIAAVPELIDALRLATYSLEWLVIHNGEIEHAYRLGVAKNALTKAGVL